MPKAISCIVLAHDAFSGHRSALDLKWIFSNGCLRIREFVAVKF